MSVERTERTFVAAAQTAAFGSVQQKVVFGTAVAGPANGSLKPAVLALAYLSAHPKQKTQSTHARETKAEDVK
jgi:hypothetical protein